MNILDNGIHASQLMRPEDFPRSFDWVTYNGAKLMQVMDNYGLDVGKPAIFIVLDANSPFDAQRRRVDCIASVRNGDYLFKKPPQTFEKEIAFKIGIGEKAS